jgi:ATP-dependent DNA ligase
MSASRELHCQLSRIEPCLPRSAKKPPAGPGWIHEIKHDGFRIIAVRDGARVRLLTRKGIDLARRFAQIAAAVAVLPVRSCIMDGEAMRLARDFERYARSVAAFIRPAMIRIMLRRLTNPTLCS